MPIIATYPQAYPTTQDDILSVAAEFDTALRTSIRIVYECASLGLPLGMDKCSPFPRHAICALGTIVDLNRYQFRLSQSRIAKLRASMDELQRAVTRDATRVPAKLIASFLGLVYSIAICCHRAATVMVRAITACLTSTMRHCIMEEDAPLKFILASFWKGTVRWSKRAQEQLDFWRSLDLSALRSHISADVIGKILEHAFDYPQLIDTRSVSALFQDASGSASGGGIAVVVRGRWVARKELFLAMFTRDQCEYSSTLRELLGILWCLQSMQHATRTKIVFACDNWQSVEAIKRGSRILVIQLVAEQIFLWCAVHNKVCWPVWLPRHHRLIKEADRRSRLSIMHDQRSPVQLVAFANALAQQYWSANLSFDQAASHTSAVSVNGSRLPFNAVCVQPGASGVDMFRQWRSWRDNICYVYPPRPMIGRLVTFLPTVRARAVVVFPAPPPIEWWTFAIQRHAPGLVHRTTFRGFVVLVFDFSKAARSRG